MLWSGSRCFHRGYFKILEIEAKTVWLVTMKGEVKKIWNICKTIINWFPKPTFLMFMVLELECILALGKAQRNTSGQIQANDEDDKFTITFKLKAQW